MKITSFSKILFLSFLVSGLSVNAQVKVKTNTSNKTVVKPNQYKTNKKVTVKRNQTKVNNRDRVRVKNNRNRIVVNKPNRPKVVVKSLVIIDPVMFGSKDIGDGILSLEHILGKKQDGKD